MEIWKDVEGYEGLYQVSNEGRVKSLDRYVDTSLGVRLYKGKVLTPSHNDSGYHIVNLSKNGKLITHRVHILVAQAFLPNPENKPCIDHRNSKRDCNVVENLRWCTYKENSNFELAKQHLIDSHKTQTNEKLMKKVEQLDNDGNVIAEYKSSKCAADAVGCSSSAITKACREGIPIKGFFWRYKKRE